MKTEIYEDDEFCAKCGSTENVGKWFDFSICEKCWQEKEAFQIWIRDLFKEVLEESPDYEKLPNGNYKFIGK